jgi:aryl-alcohol dehydrogenase-like predicted oxidoreductase
LAIACGAAITTDTAPLRPQGASQSDHKAQPPYNLFERTIERDVLPYCTERKIVTLAYGSLCRGLLTGRMTAATQFGGDDLRRQDPKFQMPRFQHYIGPSNPAVANTSTVMTVSAASFAHLRGGNLSAATSRSVASLVSSWR